MRIIAAKVKARDLRPGDLFSNVGQNYWDDAVDGFGGKPIRSGLYSVGERVYIRTDTPCPENQAEEDIYRITIERGDKE